MEKVKITQEQADTFKKLIKSGITPASIVESYFTERLIYNGGHICLLHLNADDFIRALYNGYEIE